jgi:hypothetical protein
MRGSEEKISCRQTRAIVALLAGLTVEKAAVEVNVGCSTLRRWLTEQAFQDALEAGRRQAMELGFSAIAGAVHEAVGELRVMAMNPATKSTARVIALKAIIDAGFVVKQKLDIEPRLRRLEKLAAKREGRRWPALVA